MAKVLIKNGLVINRGESNYQDILIADDRIERIDSDIHAPNASIIDAGGKWIIPGIIDDQVHFREPGFEYKANIYTESRAALAGGVTSFMEMPNTRPPAITQERLEEKYALASKSSITNYSFYMGASNDNLQEVLRTNSENVCGIKIFMGSSTGNMLVDDARTLENIFSKSHMLIATHCEDEETIRHNNERYKSMTGITVEMHPVIRSREGCLKSSSMAVKLAKKHGTRLHILHISTKEEIGLFDSILPLEKKKITAEACVHHLFFNDNDYGSLGNLIKCNPAIKSLKDQAAIFKGLLSDKIDVIATDHAPHSWEEKSMSYFDAPSGLPLVQHGLVIMLDFYNRGMISKEKIVEKMCHAPATLFSIAERGYLDEGKIADLAIVDPTEEFVVEKEDLFYKCGWSPLEGRSFKGKVTDTFVNGKHKYQNDEIINQDSGSRLTFIKRG